MERATEKKEVMKRMNEQETKEAVIVTFLAVLELMKTGKIYVQQENIEDDIFIRTLE